MPGRRIVRQVVRGPLPQALKGKSPKEQESPKGRYQVVHELPET